MKVKIKCKDEGMCATSHGVSVVDEDGNDLLSALGPITAITIRITPNNIVEAEIDAVTPSYGEIIRSHHEASLDLEGVLASVSLGLVEKLAEEHGCVLVKKEDWDNLLGADTPSVPAMYLGDWHGSTWLDAGSSVTISPAAMEHIAETLFKNWDDVVDEHKAQKSSAFDAIKDVCGG